MPSEILIPKLGLTMKEGTITRWVVADGAPVAPGDVVLTLSTDKLDTDIEAESAGRLHHIAPEGATLACGAVAGWLLADGEAAPTGAAAETPAPGGRVASSPKARRLAAELGVDLSAITGSGPGGRITAEDIEAAARAAVSPVTAVTAVTAPFPDPGSDAPSRHDVLVSPVAAELARRLGVDPASIPGSGPGGRVTLDDVLGSASGASSAAVGANVPPDARSGPGPGDTVPFTSMRRVIAERMHASLRDMAQLTIGVEVTMDRALRLRRRLGKEWGPTAHVVPGITDLIVRAAALALVDHPGLNATVGDGEIHLQREVSIGLAVAVDGGLLVPVVRHADLLPLATLSAETARLADAARSNRLGPDDLQGATFSVTALGSAGVDFFTPVINPPNVAILGVGRVKDAVAWRADRPRRTSVLTLSLTIDHRAVDGAPASAFLQTVRDLLEAPTRLLA